MITTPVRLTETELLSLDGVCSLDVQIEVNGAKERARLIAQHAISESIAVVVELILREVRVSGVAVTHPKSLRGCRWCGRNAGYATRKRWSSLGPPGTPNYDAPLHMSGVEYVERFVVVTGYSSTAACHECAKVIEPVLMVEMAGWVAEIAPRLRAPGAKVWVRSPDQHCTTCDWRGPKAELATDAVSKHWRCCPKCGAHNTHYPPFPIEQLKSSTLVEQA
jgi:hypothetical protein